MERAHTGRGEGREHDAVDTAPQQPKADAGLTSDDATHAETFVAEEGTGAASRRWAVIGFLGAALAVVALLVGVTTDWFGLGSKEDPGLLFVIPAGSAEKLERPAIDSAIEIPTKIRFGPGEAAVITIRNEDTVAHRAGPFVIDAGQTFVQRFPDPGEYPIACAVDPAESVVITVEA